MLGVLRNSFVLDAVKYLVPDPLSGFHAVSDDWHCEWVTSECAHSRLVEGFSSYYCQDCPARLRRTGSGELYVYDAGTRGDDA